MATTYADHTPWSDPGDLADRLAALPADPLAPADGLENFLIHHAAARFLKFGVPDYAERDRGLRTAHRLLATALDRDPRPLSAHRDLPAYLYGSCHDFALLAAGALRSRGIEARLRVGFVDYFRKDRWEDHWLCEYRQDGAWRLLDAQLGRRAREGHGIAFDVTDVPRERFRSGCALWLALRAGEIDPAICGLAYAGIDGDWFPAASVLRDAATLAAVEPLPWDFWGPAREIAETREVPAEARPLIDALAAAFDDPPDSPGAAADRLNGTPWARPGKTVWSLVAGSLHEQTLLPTAA